MNIMSTNTVYMVSCMMNTCIQISWTAYMCMCISYAQVAITWNIIDTNSYLLCYQFTYYICMYAYSLA